MNPSVAPGWSPHDLAEALTVTPQRVGQLTKDGILPKPFSGRYDPKTAVAAYVGYLKKGKTREQRDLAEVEKLQLGNQMRRLRLQQASGELLSRDAVNKAWFDAGRQIRDLLQNLPERLSGPLSAAHDQRKVFAVLNKEVHQVLQILAKVPNAKKSHILQAV